MWWEQLGLSEDPVEERSSMPFKRSTQVFAAGEKVLILGRFVAEPAIVVATENDHVVVAIAPQSNLTEDLSNYSDWQHRDVAAASLRRYEW
jgi:hypothetical protein